MSVSSSSEEEEFDDFDIQLSEVSRPEEQLFLSPSLAWRRPQVEDEIEDMDNFEEEIVFGVASEEEKEEQQSSLTSSGISNSTMTQGNEDQATKANESIFDLGTAKVDKEITRNRIVVSKDKRGS